MTQEHLVQEKHEHGGREKLVLRTGEESAARTVVLLHELGGLSPDTINYAKTLADSGCVVYLPVLFGKSGQANAFKGSLQVCWSRQFTILLSDRSSPIASWLGALCDTISAKRQQPIAVIGMCATGGLVFTLLGRDSVGGGVAAQPSLPLRSPASPPNPLSLGASRPEIESPLARGKPLLALRFEHDRICPAGRLVQIQESFPNANVVTLPGPHHSTLVYDANPDARRAVLDLLDRVYGGGSDGGATSASAV